MTEKKTLGDAMNLTKTQMAFVRGGAPGKATALDPDKEPAGANGKTIDLQEPVSDNPGDAPLERSQKRQSRNRARERSNPEPNDVLDQLFVPISTKVQHSTSQALKRFSFEEELKRAALWKMQDVVDLALRDFLRVRGYLD